MAFFVCGFLCTYMLTLCSELEETVEEITS